MSRARSSMVYAALVCRSGWLLLRYVPAAPAADLHQQAPHRPRRELSRCRVQPAARLALTAFQRRCDNTSILRPFIIIIDISTPPRLAFVEISEIREGLNRDPHSWEASLLFQWVRHMYMYSTCTLLPWGAPPVGGSSRGGRGRRRAHRTAMPRRVLGRRGPRGRGHAGEGQPQYTTIQDVRG